MKLSLVAIFLSLCCSTDTTDARDADMSEMRKVRRDTDFDYCKDSPAKFNIAIGKKTKRKDCSWLAEMEPAATKETCKKTEVSTHCKKTCRNENCCEDSTLEFKSGSKFVTCDWVVEQNDRCLKESVTEACTRTCTECTPPVSLEEKLEILAQQVDGMNSNIDALENKVEGLENKVDELENDNTALVSALDIIESTLANCCPTDTPSLVPSTSSSSSPSDEPTHTPSLEPTTPPSSSPSDEPTHTPSLEPTTSISPSSSSSSPSDEPSHTPDDFYFKGPELITRSMEGNPAAIIIGATDYILRFTINPIGLVRDWSSIIHFSTGDDCCNYGDRVPGIWFTGGTTKLHVVTGTDANGNEKTELPDSLELNKESTIEVRIIGKSGTLLVNESVKSTFEVGNRSPLGRVNVYIGNPWLPAANAIISDVSFVNVISDSFYFKGPKLITQSKEGNPAAVINGAVAYTLTFTIKPLGTINNDWSSVIHFSTGINNSRVPAVFMAGGSTSLMLAIGHKTGNTPALPLNEETTVRISVLGYTATVQLNGFLKTTLTIAKRTPPGDVNVYIGSPWYSAANAIISDVSFVHEDTTEGYDYY